MSRSFLHIALVALVLTAGCGSDRTTGPGTAQDDWSQVRFHQASGSGYRDLTLQPDGVLWLEDGRTGDASSARGLLAGERLETLARLIDDLPRRSYAPQASCGENGYFVSLTLGEEILTFASNPCDADAPEPLIALRDLLSMVVAEVREPRLQTVSFEVLAQGSYSEIRSPRKEVIDNLRDLIAVMQAHDPSHPVAVPRIDFRRQIVIANFLGEKPSGGHDVDLDFVERTDAGWLSLHYVEEVPGECAVSTAVTQPYVIVAVERPEGGLIFESRTVDAGCD